MSPLGSVLERVEVLHTADGLTLTAREWLRPGAQASVVLVHGFAASTHDGGVVRQAEALNEAGFNVLTYDSRGHGTSNGQCTLGDCESRDVAAAVTAAQSWDLPIVLLGASMGGIAALRYAAGAGSSLVGVVCVSSASAWHLPRTPASMLAAVLTRTPPGRWLLARQLRVQVAKRWTNPEPPVSLVARISVPLAIARHRPRPVRPFHPAGRGRGAVPGRSRAQAPGPGSDYGPRLRPARPGRYHGLGRMGRGHESVGHHERLTATAIARPTTRPGRLAPDRCGRPSPG
jgi:pimeloyl-ACP methyl ester carboxylesterase